jgi:hypothetical protein
LPYFYIDSYSEKAAAQMGASFGIEDNMLNLIQSSPSDHGKAVLNLVFQAAELFSGMEEQVRETEARSQSISKDAAEKAKLAEKRAEAAERAQREVINETGRKDARRGLCYARKRGETGGVIKPGIHLSLAAKLSRKPGPPLS